MNASKIRATSWAGIGLSVLFTIIAGGTIVGDHKITELHGDTMDKRTELCAKTAGKNVDLTSCIAEKTRAADNAATAHTILQATTIPATAIILPLSVAGLYLTRQPK